MNLKERKKKKRENLWQHVTLSDGNFSFFPSLPFLIPYISYPLLFFIYNNNKYITYSSLLNAHGASGKLTTTRRGGDRSFSFFNSHFHLFPSGKMCTAVSAADVKGPAFPIRLTHSLTHSLTYGIKSSSSNQISCCCLKNRTLIGYYRFGELAPAAAAAADAARGGKQVWFFWLFFFRLFEGRVP